MKERCRLSSKLRQILKWWVLLNVFWIRLRIVKCRLVKYRFVRYTFRFVRSVIPSILLVSIMSSRRLHDMSSRHHQDMSSRRLQRNNFSSSKTSSGGLQDAFKTSCEIFCYAQDILLRWRHFEDVFKTNKCLLGTLFDHFSIFQWLFRNL